MYVHILLCFQGYGRSAAFVGDDHKLPIRPQWFGGGPKLPRRYQQRFPQSPAGLNSLH